MDLYAALLAPGERATRVLTPGRSAWLQIARGSCALNGTTLEAGDGAAVSGEAQLRIEAATDTELLLFDLA